MNDLPMVAELLRRLIYASGEHEIAWIARDGTEAVTRCAGDLPQLVLMDLIMPYLDGVEATRQIMGRTPCPILILTASVGGSATKVFEALGAGALDAIDIPTVSVTRKTGRSLLRKIKAIERQIADKDTLAEDSGPKNESATQNLIVMGASAGGPGALANVLSTLPEDFPSAIVVIQHIDERFAQGLVDWLSKRSKLPVRLVCEDDRLISGSVFVAGGGNHLVFKKSSRLGYTTEPEGSPYCPSVDVFFASAARYFRGSITGVLLTGMGQDGARGLKTLREAGFRTIAQDQKSSAVYAMPKAAAAINAASEILPLAMIGPRLKEIFGAEAVVTNSKGRAVAQNWDANGENQ